MALYYYNLNPISGDLYRAQSFREISIFGLDDSIYPVILDRYGKVIARIPRARVFNRIKRFHNEELQ